jgi:hypothetical protein
MRSPLFGISREERAQLLRYKTIPQLAPPSFLSTLTQPTSTLVFLTGHLCLNTESPDFHEVDSIPEAEDLLFSQAETVSEKFDGLPFALRRQSTLLGHRNRRGCGNLIFTSPEMHSKLPDNQLYVDDANTGAKFGRWYSAGILRKFDKQGSQIFVCDDVPEDTAFVAYKGASDLDSVGLLFKKSGEMRLWCPLSVDIPVSIGHYITKVVFDN